MVVSVAIDVEDVAIAITLSAISMSEASCQ